MARGVPADFAHLINIAKSAVVSRGVEFGKPNGHTPHITISYSAPVPLPSTRITPIDWLIDELRLVRTVENPYRYDVLQRWPLRPPPPAPTAPQLTLL